MTPRESAKVARDAGEERKDQQRDGADGAVVEPERGRHRDQHQHGGDLQVPDQRLLRLDHAADLAAVPHPDAGMERGGVQRVDGGGDGVEDLLIVGQAHRRARRRDQDHQRVAVLAGQVAVGIAVEAGPGRLDAAHHLVEVGRGRALRLVREVDEERVGGGDARTQRRARRDQVLDLRVERAMAVEELLLRVHPPVHLRHQRRRQLLEPRRGRVDEPLARLEVVGAHHDGEVGEAADAPLQLREALRRRRALGQELAQVGAQVAVEVDGGRDAEREDGGAEQRQRPGPAQRKGRPPLPEPGDARELLHRALYAAPCLRATDSIASRKSARPESAVSRSMVRAGCRRMAWV